VMERNIFVVLQEARSALHQCRQETYESVSDYFERFISLLNAFEYVGGSIGNNEGLLEFMSKQLSSNDPGPMPSSPNATADELRQWIEDTREFEKLVAKKCRDRTAARMLIMQADERRFESLWNLLHNNYILGYKEVYPVDLSRAYDLLCNYKW
jgi:hypothetical protein